MERLCLKASSLGLVLPPSSWTFVGPLAMAFRSPRLSQRDAQVLFLCLPFTSCILLKVNFRPGYKLRRKGSTCSFLSASFFLFKE